MTIAEVIKRVQQNAGRTDKERVVLDAINRSMLRVCSEYDIPEMDSLDPRNTSPTKDYIAAPEGFRMLWNAWCNGRLLTERTLRTIADVYPNRLAVPKGRPRFLVQTGMTDPEAGALRIFRLYPAPDEVYEVLLEYARWPKTYSIADLDEELELKYKEEIIIASATAELFMHLQAYEDAAAWLATYKRMADTFWATEGRRPLIYNQHQLSPYALSYNPQADPMVKR